MHAILQRRCASKLTPISSLPRGIRKPVAMDEQCTLLLAPAEEDLWSKEEIQAALESGDELKKEDGLRALVASGMGHDNVLLMPALQNCLNSRSKSIGKLLLLFWEQIKKVGPDGKLLPELLLVVNAIRNKLTHPNEYVRGSTLRFLCKVRDAELLEPLVVPVKKCLQHRYAYVRRNAVLAVFAIASSPSGHILFPDAADEMEEFLEKEKDDEVRRNAFHMLCRMDEVRALKFFGKLAADVASQGEGFQLVVLDLARRVCRADPAKKAMFIGPIFALLHSSSSAVIFEAASALTSMSAAPTAVRAAAQAFSGLLAREADNNIKLVCLQRLGMLKERHARVLRDVVMDILSALSTPNADVRERALDIAIGLVSPRNITEVSSLLRKELAASTSAEGSGGDAAAAATYRRLLLSAVHHCAARFPEQSTELVMQLADFLTGGAAAVDPTSSLRVATLLREMAELQPSMRPALIHKACSALPDAATTDVARTLLWVVGQFALTEDQVADAIAAVRSGIGSLPLTEPHRAPEDLPEEEEEEEDVDEAAAAADLAAGKIKETSSSSSSSSSSSKSSKGPKVLADGSYATQSADASSSSSAAADDASGVPGLRRLLLKGRGDFFLASALANTLTKLALRVCAINGPTSPQAKAVTVDALLVMCALLEWGQEPVGSVNRPPPMGSSSGSGEDGGSEDASASSGSGSGTGAARMPSMRMNQDSFERIAACMRVLGDPGALTALGPVVLDGCADAFRGLLEYERVAQRNAAKAVSAVRAAVQAGGGAASAAAASRALQGVTGFSGAAGVAALKEAARKSRAGLSAARETEESEGKPVALVAQPDDLLPLRQLRGRSGPGATSATSTAELALDDEATLRELSAETDDDFAARLSRVRQLTGFSDPIYAEALVTLREYDIVLEIAVINRTDRTLERVQVELAALGDLRIVDRPPMLTLAPDGEATVRATIKVASTETGLIFGQVSFDSPGHAGHKEIVNLGEIPVDIMDYIHPSYCEPRAFRRMWAEFEWENKVSVATEIDSLQDYLAHIVTITNMHCLTPIEALYGESLFLAANLYAKSVFGEDALANVSVELRSDGRIRGNIRIRAKSQGVALALGDRILAMQKRA